MVSRAVPIVLAVALVATGCSSDEPAAGPTSAPPVSTPATTTSAPPSTAPTAPPAVDPAAYRKALAARARPVNTALANLWKATSAADLDRLLGNAATWLTLTSSALTKLSPPPAAKAQHDALIAEMRKLSTAVAGARSSIDNGESCTAEAALVTLAGRSNLPAAVRALAAKGYAAPIALRNLPVKQTRRLNNGQFVKSGGRSGRGRLTIKNGGDSDAMLALAIGRRQTFAVYVQKNATYTVTGVRNGTYSVYTATGTDFDLRAKGFTRNCGFKRFDRTLAYPAGYISSWTLTLYTVPGGNARTTDIGSNQFPR